MKRIFVIGGKRFVRSNKCASLLGNRNVVHALDSMRNTSKKS